MRRAAEINCSVGWAPLPVRLSSDVAESSPKRDGQECPSYIKVRQLLPLESVFGASVGAHFDDAGVEAGDDFDEVLLSGHYVENVFIDVGDFIGTG